MSSPNKRQLDSDDTDPKRHHLSVSSDELNSLKSQIYKEISASFDEKFTKIHQQLDDLNHKYLQLLNKHQPPELPPRDNKPPVLNRQDPPAEKPKHVFGGTLFNFKTTTPSNSFTQTPKVTPKVTPKDSSSTPETPQTSRPVFGATTSFNFNKEKKDVFADLPKSSEVQGSETKPTSSFGSNTKFTNAFKTSLTKKSFLDDQPAETTDLNTQPSQQYKQVDLEPVNNTTGEENEESHFSAMCKLFELDFENMTEGWKERGLGQLHLNQSVKDDDKVRLVMRSNGLLRVILNSRITKDTEIFKGLEASLTPGKYLRFNSVNEVGKPVQYLLKFSNPNLRDDLVEKIDSLKQQM